MPQINGHNLYVEQTGPEEGPVVVLLHHGLGSTRAWRGQIRPLTEAGYRVIAYDRWGNGLSDPRSGLDVPAFAADIDDLQDLLDQLNIQRVTLVGHSDGGTIALYFAAQYLEMVESLVAIAAHIYLEPVMENGILGVKQAFEQDERFRLGMRYAHGEKYCEVFNNWYNGWHRAELLGWDMRPLLPSIRCHSLIIQGEQDEHATPQHAKDIAAGIPGSECWILPGARHMLPQENTAEFNARLLLFLKKQPAEISRQKRFT
jgi:pimeloyl-ACP methyl ester carboxylesterase